jgi:acyl-CoA synthetase (AMP-forming)/AMP-acid ligase II
MYQLKQASSQAVEDSLIAILRKRARYQPEQVAYTFVQNAESQAHCLTYKDLDRKARELGALLSHLGLAGERALLMYPPGLEFIVAFFGCLYAGVVAVPAYLPRRNHSLERLQAIVEDSQAQEILTTAAVLRDLEQSVGNYPSLESLHWLATDNLASFPGSDWQPPSPSPEQLAFLQYTSGSTGSPKGVKVSHGNLVHNSRLIHQSFGHSGSSHGVIWLPLYHDMGLIGGVLQPLYGGFPVSLMSPVDFLQKPLRWLQAISRYGATTSGGPNFAYDLCARKITPEQKATLDLSRWQVAFTGAEPVRAETLERFAQAFAPCGFRREAFYPCYGMAEATLFITGGVKAQAPVIEWVEEEALQENRVVTASSELAAAKAVVGVGQAHGEQQVRIVNPETLRECRPGEVGEIWVSGPSVAQGYWNQPQKTAETFEAYLAGRQEGPFLRTGDLGFVRQDGELFVTGRLKDAIVIRGRNHYPQDLERTVEQSHPALRSGCGAAFAVEVGAQEQLVVVQEVERTYLRHLDVESVVGAIRQALAREHGLQAHAVILLKTGTLPKTSSGKIQRYACRTKFLAGTLAVVEAGAKKLENSARSLSFTAKPK